MFPLLRSASQMCDQRIHDDRASLHLVVATSFSGMFLTQAPRFANNIRDRDVKLFRVLAAAPTMQFVQTLSLSVPPPPPAHAGAANALYYNPSRNQVSAAHVAQAASAVEEQRRRAAAAAAEVHALLPLVPTVCPFIEVLDLSRVAGVDLSEADWAAVASLARLRELNLHESTAFSEQIAARLGQSLGFLRVLRVRAPVVGDGVFRAIGRMMSSIHELSFLKCEGVSPVGYTWLFGNRQLRKLSLAGCHELSDHFLSWLAASDDGQTTGGGEPRFRFLRSLHLRNISQLTDAALVSVASLPCIDSLELSHAPRITGAGVRAVASLIYLKRLVLHDVGGGQGVRRPFANPWAVAAPNPHQPGDAQETLLSDEDLSIVLKALLSLDELELGVLPAVTGACLESAAQHVNLRKLTLDNIPHFRGEHLEHLRGMTQLASVRITRCPTLINDHVQLLVTTVPSIEQLSLLASTSVGDEAIHHLRLLPRLTHLNIAQCHGVTRLGMARMKKLPQLTFLDVSGTAGGTDLSPVQSGLPFLKDCPNLRTLVYGDRNAARRAEGIYHETAKNLRGGADPTHSGSAATAPPRHAREE